MDGVGKKHLKHRSRPLEGIAGNNGSLAWMWVTGRNCRDRHSSCKLLGNVGTTWTTILLLEIHQQMSFPWSNTLSATTPWASIWIRHSSPNSAFPWCVPHLQVGGVCSSVPLGYRRRHPTDSLECSYETFSCFWIRRLSLANSENFHQCFLYSSCQLLKILGWRAYKRVSNAFVNELRKKKKWKKNRWNEGWE